MSRFYLFLFFVCFVFFSPSEEDQPVLDVPESSIDTSVDIQISSPEDPSPPKEAEEKISPEGNEASPLKDSKTEGLTQTVEEAGQEEEGGEKEVKEEVGQQEEILQQEESEEVRALRLKIKAYTPEYKYTVEDKKDPFSKPGALKDITTQPEDRLHPVEQDSINNIQLKAIIWGKDGVIPRALFEVANKTYTLAENDRIGQEGALIARIETDRVWAMKPVTDPSTGLVRFEPHEKTLRAEGGGTKGKELFYER